jgi:hypothetical protein
MLRHAYDFLWRLAARLRARRWDWLACYAGGTLVVVLAVLFGRAFCAPPATGQSSPNTLLASFARWDGTYYRDIARDGYSYRPGRQSTIHFWPLYPLLGSAAAALTGLPIEWALVLVSNLCFAAALALLGGYAELRGPPDVPRFRTATLLALAFLPAGFFFRMAYSESLFLLLCAAFLYLHERREHPLALAGVAGLAILTRPVGVALLPPLVVSVLGRGYGRQRAAGWLCICLPVALGGLAAFFFYSDAVFGDPLAPVRDRTTLWQLRPPPPAPEKVFVLLTLQPVWEIFQPGSPAYWGNHLPPGQVPFALYTANPLYFVAALALLAFGAARGWLNRAEVLLTAGLLLIPYWANGHETHLLSMARYASVALPLYPVLGRLFAAVPPAVAAGALGLSGFFLAVYAALFGQGYWLL